MGPAGCRVGVPPPGGVGAGRGTRRGRGDGVRTAARDDHVRVAADGRPEQVTRRRGRRWAWNWSCPTRRRWPGRSGVTLRWRLAADLGRAVRRDHRPVPGPPHRRGDRPAGRRHRPRGGVRSAAEGRRADQRPAARRAAPRGDRGRPRRRGAAPPRCERHAKVSLYPDPADGTATLAATRRRECRRRRGWRADRDRPGDEVRRDGRRPGLPARGRADRPDPRHPAPGPPARRRPRPRRTHRPRPRTVRRSRRPGRAEPRSGPHDPGDGDPRPGGPAPPTPVPAAPPTPVPAALAQAAQATRTLPGSHDAPADDRLDPSPDVPMPPDPDPSDTAPPDDHEGDYRRPRVWVRRRRGRGRWAVRPRPASHLAAGTRHRRPDPPVPRQPATRPPAPRQPPAPHPAATRQPPAAPRAARPATDQACWTWSFPGGP